MNKDKVVGRLINLRVGLAAAVVAAVAFLGLGVVALTRPVNKTTTVTVPYTQQVSFAYHASAPVGPVYPDGALNTGDPIFLGLVHQVHARVAYSLGGAAASNLTGTEQVLLRLTGPTGWTRTIQLSAPTHFTGDRSAANVTLDLKSLQSLIAQVQKQTGVPGGYTLAIAPQVHVTGTLAGQSIDTTYAPALNFQLGSVQLQPVGDQGGFTPSRRGTVSNAATAPNTIHIAGSGVQIATLRLIALMGFVLALASAVALGVLLKLRRPFGETERIQAQYGQLIVPITATADVLAWAPFDVPDIKSLVRLAERGERMILHHQDNSVDTYLVYEEGTVYRYQARPRGVVWGEWSSEPKPLASVPPPQNRGAEASA